MPFTGKKKDVEVVEIPVSELLNDSELDAIRSSLVDQHAELVIEGMLKPEVRERLRKIVQRDYKTQSKGDARVVDYIVRETIGTGVIEDILQDDRITDVGFNGKELIIETNDEKLKYNTDFVLTDEYIVRIVTKFANANNKEFTSKSPIFDGRFQNVRINAVHSQNTAPESGTTMALRVVRPKLALTEENFIGFAPLFVLDLLEVFARTKSNMVISGTTGTGKTELHKLISKFIPFNDRIILIEDTPETFMKEMFPEKDVYSWVTSEGVAVTQLIKAGLRNHPVWMMVTETRGDEAYEMIQTVLSGHSIITSLHATSASAIPSRFVNMAKMGYQLDEEALKDDIKRYFHFGLHIKKVRHNGRVIRYLNEILAFDPDGDITVFKQRFVNGVFVYETGELPEELQDTMAEMGLTVDFPANLKNMVRPYPFTQDNDPNPVEIVIPIDETGRPDLEAIHKMGTSLDSLMAKSDASRWGATEAYERKVNEDGTLDFASAQPAIPVRKTYTPQAQQQAPIRKGPTPSDSRKTGSANNRPRQGQAQAQTQARPSGRTQTPVKQAPVKTNRSLAEIQAGNRKNGGR